MMLQPRSAAGVDGTAVRTAGGMSTQALRGAARCSTRSLAARVLRPGGHVVITVRPWRERAELIDLPAQIQGPRPPSRAHPVERGVALLGRTPIPVTGRTNRPPSSLSGIG